MTGTLSEVTVLVTRPMPQGAALAERLRGRGVQAVVFPGVRIEPVQDDSLAQALSQARTAELMIFISPNAVSAAMPRLVAAGGLPAKASIAAIGPGTAEALRAHGASEIAVPADGHDSEALAALPLLQSVARKRVALFRGVGGRELLADTLRARGAEVQVIECYRRVPPAGGIDEVLARWARGRALAWSATSAEILDNLFGLADAGGSALLRGQVLLVPHARIAVRAFVHGVQRILVTGPGDPGLMSGLNLWFGRLRN